VSLYYFSINTNNNKQHPFNSPNFSINATTTTPQPFYGPFSGTIAGARRELLVFMVQGKISRGRHIDHPAALNSIQTKQCPPPPSPIRSREKMLEFSSMVLPAPSPYLFFNKCQYSIKYYSNMYKNFSAKDRHTSTRMYVDKVTVEKNNLFIAVTISSLLKSILRRVIATNTNSNQLRNYYHLSTAIIPDNMS